MARESPVEFKMYFKIHFETVIRGHQVYKRTWTPIFDQVLECEQDTRAEAREYDANAIGVYQEVKQPESIKKLVGHVPIELSSLLKNFLQASKEKRLIAQATGKRKREVGLVVPAKFTAFTKELRIARILQKELNGRAVKYDHFELKNIVFHENKLQVLY